jgi:hypothetical protein
MSDVFYDDMDDYEVEGICIHCRSNDIRYDIQQHESACANCGIVGMYDTDEPDRYYKPKTYFKSNYFVTGVIHKIMNSGLKLTYMEREEMVRLFNICVGAFHRTKDIHKRKNMISTTFTFLKIAEHMGQNRENVMKYLKMPKPETLARLEKHWLIMKPF